MEEPVVDVELLPAERRSGIAHLHAVQLPGRGDLALGAHVRLRDELGSVHDAVVVAVDWTRVGNSYAVRLGPVPSILDSPSSAG